MFETARLKLTAWYLLIIMAVSVVFSVAFYRTATAEIERIIRVEEWRQRYPVEDFLRHRNDPMRDINIQDLREAEARLRTLLIIINGGIVILAGASGYFLAGRTLQPIQTMVDEQHRFITDASHELRTPLTALRSEIEVGLRDKSMSTGDAKKLLESNLEEVIHLQNLSDNLLQLTQAKTTHQVFHDVAINNVIEAAIKKVTPIAKKKKIALAYDSSNITVEGDEMSLVQLLIILLDNAIKYSPEKTAVEIKAKKTDHSVSIKVQDQGVGIEEKDIPFIFDRFYRVDKSRSRAEGGYGLGLSIAQKIVHEHNGNISVTSKPHKGAIFTVQLPAK